MTSLKHNQNVSNRKMCYVFIWLARMQSMCLACITNVGNFFVLDATNIKGICNFQHQLDIDIIQ